MKLLVGHALIERKACNASDHRERYEPEIIQRDYHSRVLPMQAHDADELHDEDEGLIHRALPTTNAFI